MRGYEVGKVKMSLVSLKKKIEEDETKIEGRIRWGEKTISDDKIPINIKHDFLKKDLRDALIDAQESMKEFKGMSAVNFLKEK